MVLIGPINDREFSKEGSELMKMKNVHYLGKRSYEHVPGAINSADATIIPF